MNEIDLCADWKDKYQISLQNRARKYIYVEHLYDIILILGRWTLAAFVSRIHAIELIFPLDLTGWKRNLLQKNRVQMQWCISLFLQNNACWRDEHCVCLSAKFVIQKKSNSIALYWRLHFDSEKIQNKSYSSFAAQAYYDIIKYQRIVETWQEVILT